MSSAPLSMKWLLTAAGVAGCAVVGAFYFTSTNDNEKDRSAKAPRQTAGDNAVVSSENAKATETSTRPAARTPTSSDACGLAAGLRFGATVESSSSFEATSGSTGSPTGKKQSVSGYLAFEVLEASPSSAVVLVGFSNENAVKDDGSASAIASPFLARVNDQCEVAAFARHRETSTATARLQQSLLHELWFSIPAQGAKTSVQFDNSVGHAMGHMEVDAGGDLVRTINLYRDPWSPDMVGVRVRKATLRISRGDAPWFSRLDGIQELTVPASQTAGVSTILVEATDYDEQTLYEASRNPQDYAWESMLKPFSRAVTAVQPMAQGERIAAMKEVTFEQALTRFGTLVETKAQQEQHHLIMAAFLDAHPEHIEEYSKALASHFPDNWKPPGYAALQVTQHSAAKEALLALFRETRLAPMERIRSSLALSGRADVGVSLARELSAVATSRAPTVDKVNVPDHALMHLGVLAGLHTDDAEIVTLTRATILAKLQSATTPEDLKTATLAVANTGDLTFLAPLQEWSRYDDADMREQVAFGLRRMPIDGTRAFVVEWLERETSFRVKREIFEVLQKQYHDANAVLDEALVAQAVAHLDQRPRALTRQSIYRLLTPVVRVNPDVRRALRELLVLEVEKDSGMAHYLMRILPPQDVKVALASIETLADQFSASATDPSSTDPTPSIEPQNPEPPFDLVAEFENLGLGDTPRAEGLVTE